MRADKKQWRNRKARKELARQQKMNDHMVFSESPPDLMQRLSCLPTVPHIGPLGGRKLPSSRGFHEHHL